MEYFSIFHFHLPLTPRVELTLQFSSSSICTSPPYLDFFGGNDHCFGDDLEFMIMKNHDNDNESERKKLTIKIMLRMKKVMCT